MSAMGSLDETRHIALGLEEPQAILLAEDKGGLAEEAGGETAAGDAAHRAHRSTGRLPGSGIDEVAVLLPVDEAEPPVIPGRGDRLTADRDARE